MSRPCRRPALAALMLLVPLLVTALAPAAAAVPPPATPTESTPVMVVLDASGSMKQADAPGPRIDAAKRAVGELVAALPDDARVGLTVYGTGTGSSDAEKARGCKDITQLVPVERVDRAAFGRAVAGLRASGYTPIGESLRVAARGLPAEGPRSIVLVSDGRGHLRAAAAVRGGRAAQAVRHRPGPAHHRLQGRRGRAGPARPASPRPPAAATGRRRPGPRSAPS